jgi:GTP 3',8-cyclase
MGCCWAGMPRRYRVNVSLDSLRPDRFRAITRRGDLDMVLAGIEAAFTAGLEPLKINTVVMRGRNDDEIVDLARKTLTEPWHVRFIEWMPVGEVAQGRDWRADVVTMAEVRARIEDALGRLLPASVSGAGPARVYRVPEAVGTLGFIGAVSEHFCASCNRLRLTADGKLRPCLLAPEELDLRAVLRGGGTKAEIQALLLAAIRAKPGGHRLGDDGDGPVTSQQHPRAMAQIGG